MPAPPRWDSVAQSLSETAMQQDIASIHMFTCVTSSGCWFLRQCQLMRSAVRQAASSQAVEATAAYVAATPNVHRPTHQLPNMSASEDMKYGSSSVYNVATQQRRHSTAVSNQPPVMLHAAVTASCTRPRRAAYSGSSKQPSSMKRSQYLVQCRTTLEMQHGQAARWCSEFKAGGSSQGTLMWRMFGFVAQSTKGAPRVQKLKAGWGRTHI